MAGPRPCADRLRSDQGSALVIVLTLVAMIMMLVLAVLETGAASTRRSRLTATNSEADALEQIPAQVIISQLQRATTQSVTATGERLLWTSQPGMIRTFGSSVKEGQERPPAQMHYRLYSAPVMNSATLDQAFEASALSTWAARPAGFTDLNEPAFSTRMDTAEPVFPIADAQALGRVDGFALRSPAPGVTPEHPLPMPAAWIYVLRDGRLVTPATIQGSKATFPAGVVTLENPITGRIAFWTDDESCKLNLNTASEASPWDMPAANTRTEAAYAAHAPKMGEYFRMSGHPAFTSLSPVLKSFGGATAASLQWPKADAIDPAGDGVSAWQQMYQSLVPHGADAHGGVRQDRHFATVDEFFFDPQRRPNGHDAGFQMEAQDLNLARFFLTTHSASPELNPFGGPKIALWMMPQEVAARSTADKRVAAATCLNPGMMERHDFAFQRASQWSGTASPGSSQSMSDDWSQVKRNRELYAWLQTLSGLPMPGNGGRFLDKYGGRSRDQILTSMLDLLRWSANKAGYLPPSLGALNAQGQAEQSAMPLAVDSATGNTRGYGRFPTITEVAVVFAFTDVERLPDGRPRDDNADGICDKATKLRAFMVVNPFLPACGPPAVSPAWSVRIRRLMQWTVGAGISLQLPGGNVRNRCTLSGAQALTTGAAWGGGSSAYPGFASQFMQASGVPKEIGKRDDPARDFCFVSLTDINLQSNGGPDTELKFSGGRVIVDLMEPDAPPTQPKANDAIHSVEVEFPPVQLPVPSLKVADFIGGVRRIEDRLKPVLTGGEMRLPLIQPDDVVRSMHLAAGGPSHGDARLLAARRELLFPEAAGWFAPHAEYATTTAITQSLRDGAYLSTGQYGAPELQATSRTAGSLLPNMMYAANAIPAVPPGLNGAMVPPVGSDPGGRLGDWESGAGVFEDGAFVGRSQWMPEAVLTRGPFIVPGIPDGVEPLAQISSAISFGALPSGLYGDATVTTPRPWQTLLFCPNPAGRSSPASQRGRFDSKAHDHFGLASPPDHLWLEFFTMPVTEPWPMSSGLATEGKVNLNHQLMPFTWMQRATALHGALKGVRITAIPTTALDASGASAKGRADGTALDATFRYEVDAEKTVQGLNQRLDAGEVFRTPSEICEQFLVPKRIEGHAYEDDGFSPQDPATLTANDMTEWWNGSSGDPGDAFEATGDNLREAPYAQLYPRLCTQSNVYRVHYRVQVLKKSRSTRAAEWDEEQDLMTAERRGSVVIERRLTPSANPLPDPATTLDAPSLHERQSFHILSQTRFSP